MRNYPKTLKRKLLDTKCCTSMNRKRFSVTSWYGKRGQAMQDLVQQMRLSPGGGAGTQLRVLERQGASTAPEVFLAVTRLLHHMANIFQDSSLPQSKEGTPVRT